ncbi:Predicted DNA-binding transcriptional regulator YafY, contains an HTH and WYL domains [Chitinophaga costaii]|uniref:Predicted DNA-binding transcriptional regulator YafY, contains an HTH and WYL domains n=1 Tax=Chitinophaga costaii TaxID=1335309 RepID=A0A1C4G3W7_9BACT|nr:WYL domain-containing protein [Chitinophaga costaii]PUZ22038.1 WYL domain-containing protein [Chitinophaga costaii]SCC62908.1 Predicted DNA-binding transcriptional regulator YafY, contains an HTH and WYL domains [Chitinophaga costaii]
MPKNKDAVSRYRWIDERLRNKRLPKPTLEHLIGFVSEKMGKDISTRAIQQDIYDMRNDQELAYFAPILYDRKTGTYRYEEESYSINNNPIDEADLQGLEIAIGILEQFRSLPVVAQFEDAILKIAASLKMNRDALQNQGLIRFARATQYKGAEFIPEIVDAIKGLEVIRIAYQSFNRDEPKEHWVEPYHLREYQHRFYLIGKSQQAKGGSVLTFALDRIVKLWPTNQHFDAQNFDDATYFQHSLGITVPGGDPEEVRLSFTPQQGKYIKSQPIHPSQEIVKDTEESCEVKLQLVVNPELRMLLLSYGANLKVLAPQSLVKDLADEAKRMAALYK